MFLITWSQSAKPAFNKP